MAYCLPVSASKTKATIFYKRKGFVPPKIWINGNEIDYDPSPKLLGIHLDHGLTWKNHIDFVKKSCMKRLILLKRLATTKWASSPTILLDFYKRFIWSKIEYGIEAYGGCCKTSLAKLETLQSMAIKIVLVFTTIPQITRSGH